MTITKRCSEKIVNKLLRKDKIEATLDGLDKSTRELQEAAQMAIANHLEPPVGKKAAVVAPPVSNEGSGNLPWDEIKPKILQWLSPPDPSTNYDSARLVRHEGTAEWFLGGNVFKEWKSRAKGSLLWIRGMRMFVILPSESD